MKYFRIKQLLILNTLYFILSASNCFSQSFRSAQSFDKGTITANAGVGIGVSAYASNDDSAAAFAAVPVPVQLSIEYGISNYVGAGLIFEPNVFLNSFFVTRNDSGSANALNIGGKLSYYFTNRESETFFVDVVAGYSSVKYTDKTREGKENNGKASGTGFTYRVSLGYMSYFSKKAGWFVNFGYAGSYYTKLIGQGGNANPISPELLTSDGSGNFLLVNMNGVNLKAGIVIKLL